MKIVLYVVGGIVVLGIIAFFVVAFSLGSIVKNGINRVGPEMTQTTVVLQSAEISPFSGEGTLSHLVIGNPQGWTTDHAFSLGKITIAVEPRSLMSDHIVIDKLIIEQPDIIYESNISNSNLQDLLKNIQQSEKGTADQPVRNNKGQPIKIEIRNFQLLSGKITANVNNRTLNIPMPDLTLQNLGTQQGGLTPQQLSFAIMKEVTTHAVQAGAKTLLNKELLNEAGSKASYVLKKFLGGNKNSDTAQPQSSTP